MAGRFFGTADAAATAFASEVLGARTDVITATRPPLKSATPAPKPIHAAVRSHMDEYAALAALVGVKSPDLGIEGFAAFLEANGITVFSLAEVIKYMDAKAVAESKDRCGWEWRPLREKDNRQKISFGTRAERHGGNWTSSGRSQEIVTVPASDYYVGPSEVEHIDEHGRGHFSKTSASRSPYDRPIPLHALRKVALIECDYKGDAAFFVSDYALAPQIQYPDPFLMVVVPNLDVKLGVGRFVIDFWDEPGFGLEQQLAP